MHCLIHISAHISAHVSVPLHMSVDMSVHVSLHRAPESKYRDMPLCMSVRHVYTCLCSMSIHECRCTNCTRARHLRHSPRLLRYPHHCTTQRTHPLPSRPMRRCLHVTARASTCMCAQCLRHQNTGLHALALAQMCRPIQRLVQM